MFSPANFIHHSHHEVTFSGGYLVSCYTILCISLRAIFCHSHVRYTKQFVSNFIFYTYLSYTLRYKQLVCFVFAAVYYCIHCLALYRVLKSNSENNVEKVAKKYVTLTMQYFPCFESLGIIRFKHLRGLGFLKFYMKDFPHLDVSLWLFFPPKKSCV